MININSCEYCKFYDRVHGECRKNSPKPSIISLMDWREDNQEKTVYKVVWPPVKPTDWCGDYINKAYG